MFIKVKGSNSTACYVNTDHVINVDIFYGSISKCWCYSFETLDRKFEHATNLPQDAKANAENSLARIMERINSDVIINEIDELIY